MNRPLLSLLAVTAAVCLASCSQQAAPPPPSNALTLDRGETHSAKALEILNRSCTACHTAERFSSRAFTEQEWNVVIDRMVTKGAKLSGEELDVLRHSRAVK